MEGNSIKLISKYRTHIMGFAAFWILLFHAWVVVSEQYSMVWRVEYFIKKTGFAGVDIFFFVSGLGLVHAIEKYSIKEFYARRFINTYPAFFLTGVALVFTRNWDIVAFFRNVLGIKFYTESIYQLLWFVPAILTLYLLFPLYYNFFKKASNKVEFTACVWIIWLILSLALESFMGNVRPDLYGFTNRIPIFIVGILVGDFMRKREIVFDKSKWTLIVFGLSLGIYLAYYTSIKGQRFVVHTSDCCFPNFFIAICGSILLAKLFWLMDTYLKNIGKVILKIFYIMGIASLEIYCAQEEVVLLHHKLEIENVFLENIVTMVIIFVIAWILYYLCKWIKKGLSWILIK